MKTKSAVARPKIVSDAEWQQARNKLLVKEKAETRRRDEIRQIFECADFGEALTRNCGQPKKRWLRKWRKMPGPNDLKRKR